MADLVQTSEVKQSVLTNQKRESEFFDTEYLKSDLKGRSVRGGAITIFSQNCKFVLKMGSTVVLARLLTPADFGLITMVMALTNFAMMFKDLGLSMATIQKPDINHAQISTLFWINAAVGVFIAAIVAALAPAVAWFYGEPRLMPVTIALAGAFVFGGLTVQHQALLRRHMNFFRLGLVEISAMAIGVAAAITAGAFGAGYWSLVIMHVVLAVSMAVGMWIVMPWLPGLPRRKTGVREMLGFGGNLTACSVVNYVGTNVDHVLIGKFSGAAALGLYSKAYGLMLLPLRQIRVPLTSVAVASLSRLQDNAKEYRQHYSQMVYFMSFFAMPLVAFLVVMSEQAIVLILGPGWLGASEIFAILGIFALLLPVWTSHGWLFITTGQTSRMLRLNIADAVLLIAAVAVGANYGPKGVALAITLTRLVFFIPGTWYASRGTPVDLKTVLDAVRKPLLASVVMATMIYFVHKSILSNLSLWYQILFGFIAAAFIYLAVSCLIETSWEPLRKLNKIKSILLSRERTS